MAGISEVVTLTRTIGELVKKGVTLELQEKITELREAVLEAKDEVLSLREENQALKSKLAEQESWNARAARYTLVTTIGGAHVYQTDGPPPHFACPRCFEEQKVRILQDRRVIAGTFGCSECGKEYPVYERKSISPAALQYR